MTEQSNSARSYLIFSLHGYLLAAAAEQIQKIDTIPPEICYSLDTLFLQRDRVSQKKQYLILKDGRGVCIDEPLEIIECRQDQYQMLPSLLQTIIETQSITHIINSTDTAVCIIDLFKYLEELS